MSFSINGLNRLSNKLQFKIDVKFYGLKENRKIY